MKKILILFVLVLAAFYSKAQVPCSFTKSIAGSTVSVNYLWILPLIYSVDSVYLDYGDGTSVMQYAPVPGTASHTYTAPGSYYICLTRYMSQIGVPGAIVCTYCDSVSIGSSSSCFVSASYNATAIGLTANFTNTTSCATCSSISHAWNFGDGSPINTQTSPSHVYAANGSYNVCLISTGTNSSGQSCSDTTCTTVTVSNNQSCSANASFTASAGSSTVNFTNNSSCTGCLTTTYSWSFGDGSPLSTAMNPTHTYANGGVYVVCLVVTGVSGTGNVCVDSFCTPITVTGALACNINAAFTSSTNQLNASFSNTTSCSGCSSWNSLWDFGDGSMPTTQTSPTHSYSAAGTYSVCLYVVGLNSGGQPCLDTLCQNVSVLQTAIEDYYRQSLQVYPNPTTDQFQISLPANTEANELQLLDITGRIIQQWSLSKQATSKQIFDIRHQADGIYLLRLESTEGSYQGRIQKRGH